MTDVMIATDPRQLAVVRSYDDLHRALRLRKEALEITMNCLDEAAGFTAGHASKLLAPKPLKNMGPLTLGLMLQALGVQLIMVEDAEALERIRPKLTKSRLPPAMRSVSRTRGRHSKKPNLISKRFMRKIGRKGGEAYANAPFKTRSRVGMAGAKARWAMPKLEEITSPSPTTKRSR
jgi:hypothetical protein